MLGQINEILLITDCTLREKEKALVAKKLQCRESGHERMCEQESSTLIYCDSEAFKLLGGLNGLRMMESWRQIRLIMKDENIYHLHDRFAGRTGSLINRLAFSE